MDKLGAAPSCSSLWGCSINSRYGYSHP